MRTGKFTRVRYLRINRMCLEIVNGLTDQAKAVFLDQCLAWFLQLENGEIIEMVDTGNPLLNLALREEIAELQEGFAKYMQAVDAKKKSETADMPPTDRNNTAEVPPTGLSKQEQDHEDIKGISKTSSSKGIGKPFDEVEQSAINSQLDYAKIIPDRQFWAFARKVGYRVTMDSIRKAQNSNSSNLSYVVKLMREAMNE